MKIGVIGAGYIGGLLAKKFVEAGFNVELSNSRGPETLQMMAAELGENAAAVTVEQAAKNDIIVLAVKWESVQTALNSVVSLLDGKIIIDATNPFSNNDKLLELSSSASEIVASYVPHAHIVKAFNSLYGDWIDADPVVNNGNRVVFISGDNKEAKKTVSKLVNKMGFSPIDIGDLKTGELQQTGKPLGGLNLIHLS
ncbi:NADPH-dependent F420 reductase [Dyadobacter subterraneus]|uniref:NADPH-dependent F420 reductase n=1 Tax=Dyadobacter subterraneus TaxID=2773304 RepID=A0ABR9W766_9BACT|nr:NADPH-dependent F420 reductase [Dyadobacter subterraneus]MBE9461309.1 NADPH-dependent F420 reductase [Dyadobacter subterraneus]